MKKFLMFAFGVMLFIPSILHAEGKETIQAYRPASLPRGILESKKDLAKSSIKNSGYYAAVLKYLALRSGNLSLCNDQTCRDSVEEDLFLLRYGAEGRCEEIQDRIQQELCLSLKANNCSMLSGWEKVYCQGLLDGDVALVQQVNIERDPNFSGSLDPQEEQALALYALAIYKAYEQNGHYAVCEQYMDKIKINNREISLIDQLACRFLFYPNPEQQKEEILDDLALLVVSKKENNRDICDQVKDAKIKRACLSQGFTKLKDIFFVGP